MHKVLEVYYALYEAYGPQNWWPASSDLEMMLGAILVQNTAWTNAEKALQNLPMDVDKLMELSKEEIQTRIATSGSYKRKSQCIVEFIRYFKSIDCDVSRLEGNALLEIHGIGKETRDCMLLYAKREPVFVVDTYLKRLLESMNLLKSSDYDFIQSYMENAIPKDLIIYQEFHALIVEYGKRKKNDIDPLASLKNPIFKITDDALEFLSKDSQMKILIDYYGVLERPVMNTLYDTITYTIIGQLLSVKAAQSIKNRFNEAYPWPEDVLKSDIETLRAVGLTQNKAKAIYGIAQRHADGELDERHFAAMSDDEIVKQLIKFSGLGDWSARMVMIHGLKREDVSTYDDIAIRRGVSMAYSIDAITREVFDDILLRFSPYRTVASIYFWALSKESMDTKKAIFK